MSCLFVTQLSSLKPLFAPEVQELRTDTSVERQLPLCRLGVSREITWRVSQLLNSVGLPWCPGLSWAFSSDDSWWGNEEEGYQGRLKLSFVSVLPVPWIWSQRLALPFCSPWDSDVEGEAERVKMKLKGSANINRNVDCETRLGKSGLIDKGGGNYLQWNLDTISLFKRRKWKHINQKVTNCWR